jgi:hypothetical protein
MHKYLAEFKKETIDVAQVARIIHTGKPVKIMGIFNGTPLPLNLFNLDTNGSNIFTYLADKGQLPNLLHIFFGKDASSTMLKREGIADPQQLKSHMFDAAKRYIKFLQDNRNVMESPNSKHINCVELALISAILQGNECYFEQFKSKQLYKHLPVIVKTVQLLQENPVYQKESFRVFVSLFQNHWPDILSYTEDIQSNMSKMLHLSKAVQTPLQNSITMDEWAGLLGVPSFKDIEQVKSYILEKCAESFLAGTLPNMEFNSLIVNRGAVAALKLEELEAAVEAVAPVPVVDVPAEVEAAVRAPLADLLAPTPFVPDAEKTHDGATSAAAPSNLSEVKENTRPDANPPSLGKTLSVSQLAKELVKQICQNDKYKDGLTKDVGKSPHPLAIFFSMHSRNPTCLNEMLHKIATKTKTLPMRDIDFIEGYVTKLKYEDLICTTKTKTPYNAFDLACLTKDANFIMPLFKQGLALEVYSTSNINDLLHSAMRYNAPSVVNSLLEQAEGGVGLYFHMTRAMKYCNSASKEFVSYYKAHGELSMIKDIKNSKGEETGILRYNVLNKIMYYYYGLVEIWSISCEQDIHHKAANKLLDLTSIVNLYISTDRIYYAEDNLKVIGRGLLILDKLVRHMHEIKHNQETKKSIDAVQEIVLFVVNKYAECPDLQLSQKVTLYLDNLIKYVNGIIDTLETLSSTSAMTDNSQGCSIASRMLDEQDLSGFENELNDSVADALVALGHGAYDSHES